MTDNTVLFGSVALSVLTWAGPKLLDFLLGDRMARHKDEAELAKKRMEEDAAFRLAVFERAAQIVREDREGKGPPPPVLPSS